MTLAVGLAGLGFGEKVLLPALRRSKAVRVAGVACAHPQKSREAAARLKIPYAAEHWRDLVDDPRIDALAFALPPTVQFDAARRALRLGKPVFCEKPLTVRGRQAQELARLSARKKLAGAVDFELPQIGAWRRAKELLDGGAIGELREMQVIWNIETYAVKNDLHSWKTNPASGGAALNNFASHTFHYVEHFVGPIRRLNCRLIRARGLKRVKGETGVCLWLVTREGVPVSAEVATHIPGESEHRIVWAGSRGKLALGNRGADYGANFGLRLERTGQKPVWVVRPAAGREDGRIEPVSRIVEAWVKSIRGRKTCRPGLAEGARVQRLIEWARLSDRAGRWVACG